jgi:hypothetical protein
MKRTFPALIITYFFLASCIGHKEKQIIDVTKINPSFPSPDSVFVLESILPSVPELHWFKNWIVVICSSQEADQAPLTFINAKTMNVEFTLGVFGRGPGEFTSINPYYFEKTDTSIAVHTNAFYETKYIYTPPNSFRILYSSSIAFEPLNGLTKISDTIFTFRNDDRDSCNYVVFNTLNQRRISRFREQPDIGARKYSFADCRKFFSSWLMINDDKTSLADFYVFNPVIHFYDRNYKLRKAVWTQNSAGCTFGDDIRNGSCTEYFESPKKAAGLIWVKYLNKSKRQTRLSTELQAWSWDGYLRSRYMIEKSFFHYIVSDDGKSLFILVRDEDNDKVEKYNLE